MKTIFKTLGVLSIALFVSCSDSDDNSIDNINSVGQLPQSNLTIKAAANFGATAKSTTNANLSINSFLINLKKIEFEYSDDFNGINTSGGGSSSNDDDDDYISFDQLPLVIQTFIQVNFPNDPFCKAKVEEDDDDPYKYEVELQSGLELYFLEDGSLFASEQDDSPCSSSSAGSGSSTGSTSWGDDDEVTLAGPFEIELVAGQSTVITNINIPIGEYEEVKFKMDINKNPSSNLYQKSVMITGMLNGMPMTFYHVFEEEFEVDFEDAGQNLIIDNSNNNSITFNFDLNAVVNAVDFSSATDGNGDGTIEISPIDTDGNNALAADIKNAIVLFAELLDD